MACRDEVYDARGRVSGLGPVSAGVKAFQRSLFHWASRGRNRVTKRLAASFSQVSCPSSDPASRRVNVPIDALKGSSAATDDLPSVVHPVEARVAG